MAGRGWGRAQNSTQGHAWSNVGRSLSVDDISFFELGLNSSHPQRQLQEEEEEGSAAEAASSSPSGRPRIVNVWETDPELRLFKRLRDRDANDYGPLLDMFGLGDDSAGELEEFWSDPDVAHQILTSKCHPCV